MSYLWSKFFLLERYLFGQMITPVLAGVGGATVLLTASKLFNLADKLVVDKVPALDVLKLLVLDIPATAVLGMPIAGMFATMLMLGKLSGNSEITAMRAGGIPFVRIFLPVLLMGLTMSGISFAINNGLVPPSKQSIREIDQQALLAQPQQAQTQDVFFKSDDNLWFFIRSVDPRLNTMRDVTILKVQPDVSGKTRQLSQVTLAAEATWNGQEWTLNQGVAHFYDGEGVSLREEPFSRQTLRVSDDLATLMQPAADPSELTLAELNQNIDSLTSSNLNTQGLRTEQHMRYSLPLASFFAVFISIPLATHTARQVGRYGGVVFGILLVFVYYVILNVSRSLGEAGAVEPWLAAWSQNIIFGGVGSLLIGRFLR
ncbi:MAG: LptF/LptG family permease [Cyanobacteriota bacterium]|nr:LptF/LptG family permease [Cyanobacteriota bacterium]